MKPQNELKLNNKLKSLKKLLSMSVFDEINIISLFSI